jgi:hypothetical protein
LEGKPTPGRYPERRKVAEVDTFVGAATEDVHHIIDKGCRMPFTRSWNNSDGFKLTPTVRAGIVGPNVIEPLQSVRSSESAVCEQWCYS